MTFHNIFSEFCYKVNLNDQIDVKLFEDSAYKCREIDSGVKISNAGGWHSSIFNSFEHDDPKQKLISIIDDELKIVSKKFGLDLRDKKRVGLSTFWFNINGYKDYNKIHSHLKSIFSGVYYIKVPDKCGRLVLDSPAKELMRCYLDYWHLEEGEHNEYNSMIWNISPKPGDLVIFPSWVPHYTEPNMSNEDRISFSFNSQVNPPRYNINK